MNPVEKNSAVALERALLSGFGIETDLRDINGKLVISHDPPKSSDDLIDATCFFNLVRSSGAAGRLALNVKSDGLQKLVVDALDAAFIPKQQVFAFDMSVPDALVYAASEFPIYTRISEYEKEPAFLNLADGVWVDNFTGDFPQISRAAKLLAQGTRVTIVSPELHCRNHQPLWNELLAARLHESSLFELCTDLPMEASAMFCSTLT